MRLGKIPPAAFLILSVTPGLCMGSPEADGEAPFRRFSLSTTWLSFDNFGPEATNIHMYEVHAGYRISRRDRIAIKACTWKLFEPMGIPLWDPLLMEESEWYPGKIHEFGIGLGYQRSLWKGLFAALEILPLRKIYLDESNAKVDEGFKLYTSYHLGYHLSLFKGRFFLEPQVHCNHWPLDSEGPPGFEAKEVRWKDYFLLEPNLFLGFAF